MECEHPSSGGGCSREVHVLLVFVLSIVATGCARCGSERLQQIEACRIESNRTAPEICNDKDDNCSCPGDTNNDGTECGPGDDGVDEGCDDDRDGYCDPAVPTEGAPKICGRPGSDCNDEDAKIHPNGAELCNGNDDDCNGLVDDALRPETDVRFGQTCGQETVPASKVGIGVCTHGKTACPAGAIICAGATGPSPEECDGKDNDCNGTVDDGSHLFAICQSTDNPRLIGECRPGVNACVNGRMDLSRCLGEVKPTSEVCDGKDNDCDGETDVNCGISVVCPTDTTTPVGIPVTLDATATSQNGTITGYAWTVISGPQGGVGTPNQWTPAPPIDATETFLPTVAGTYVIRISASDSTGASASCDTRVTALYYGLRVELSWDGPADLDLHLHDSNATSWFSGPQDCYYGNPNPDWSMIGPNVDDPHLDMDNTSGFGPENIRIQGPTIGAIYTVGVHNFSRGSGRTATLRFFCGTSTTPQATMISRVFNGTSPGNCTMNDFWKAATVVFTSSGTCTVTAVDTWGTGQDRCQAF